jgi:hypothetical protein
MLRDAMREKARLLKASMTRKLRRLTQNQNQTPAEEEAKSDDDDEQEGEMDVCARETNVVVVGGRMGGKRSAFAMLATLRMANESWTVRRFVHLAQQLEFWMQLPYETALFFCFFIQPHRCANVTSQAKEMNKRMMKLWKLVYNYVDDDDQWFAADFMNLPSKRDYPVYYSMCVISYVYMLQRHVWHICTAPCMSCVGAWTDRAAHELAVRTGICGILKIGPALHAHAPSLFC